MLLTILAGTAALVAVMSAAEQRQPPPFTDLITTVSTRNKDNKWVVARTHPTNGQCRPDLTQCGNVDPNYLYMHWNPEHGTGPEHPLDLYNGNDKESRYVVAAQGTCKLILYSYIDDTYQTPPASSMSFRVDDVMHDLMGRADTQDKFPSGEDNVSFSLFPLDERVCVDPDYPDGDTIPCRNVRSPLRAMMQYNPEAPDFCSKCASKDIPGFCYRCCPPGTTDEVCKQCAPSTERRSLSRTFNA